MTKAVFAGEKVKKFSFQYRASVLRTFDAPVSGFTKNFFMSHRSADAGNRHSQHKKPYQLQAYIHRKLLIVYMLKVKFISHKIIIQLMVYFAFFTSITSKNL